VLYFVRVILETQLIFTHVNNIIVARALAGFLDVGYKPEQLRVLTRNATKAEQLRQQFGFDTVVGNLDSDDGYIKRNDTTKLNESFANGCIGCYIHSTSSDTRKLDTKEVDRATYLCKILLKNNIRNIVFHSAVGEKENGVQRIQQKHDVEQVFLSQNNLFFTSLRANLLMEELWKGYTRPSILKGKFPFMVPSSRPIYLTSVRDMGRLAGAILASQHSQLHSEATAVSAVNSTMAYRILNVAGDLLTPKDIAEAFAKEQGSPCTHSESRVFALIVRLLFQDLFEIVRFYRKSRENTDIDELKQEFPGLLSNFSAFLSETHWADRERTFQDL
jgi:hypothetical protein